MPTVTPAAASAHVRPGRKKSRANVASLLSEMGSMKMTADCPWKWDGKMVQMDVCSGYHYLLAMAYIHEGVTEAALPDDAYMAAESDEHKEAMGKVRENYDNIKGWYLTLVACHQVRKLSTDNIANFFAKENAGSVAPGSFIKLLDFISDNEVPFAENEDIRKKFEDDKFFEYHTTSNTTPALCTRAIECCPFDIMTIFDKKEVDAVALAYTSRWNIKNSRLISETTVAKCSAILEALDILPKTWYMGKRARENYSPVVYSRLVTLINAYGKKAAGFKVDDATTMDDMAKGIVDMKLPIN